MNSKKNNFQLEDNQLMKKAHSVPTLPESKKPVEEKMVINSSPLLSSIELNIKKKFFLSNIFDEENSSKFLEEKNKCLKEIFLNDEIPKKKNNNDDNKSHDLKNHKCPKKSIHISDKCDKQNTNNNNSLLISNLVNFSFKDEQHKD